MSNRFPEKCGQKLQPNCLLHLFWLVVFFLVLLLLFTIKSSIHSIHPPTCTQIYRKKKCSWRFNKFALVPYLWSIEYCTLSLLFSNHFFSFCYYLKFICFLPLYIDIHSWDSSVSLIFMCIVLTLSVTHTRVRRDQINLKCAYAAHWIWKKTAFSYFKIKGLGSYLINECLSLHRRMHSTHCLFIIIEFYIYWIAIFW